MCTMKAFEVDISSLRTEAAKDGTHELCGGGEGSEGERELSQGLCGRIFVDGSCTTSTIHACRRAAGAVVAMSETGKALRAVAIPVPANLPQTSQCAEHVAMAAAYQFASGQSTISGDCTSVVRATKEAFGKIKTGKKLYAGILLDLWARPEQRRRIEDVFWVKAHARISDSTTDEEALNIVGNGFADTAAKMGVRLHPQPSLAEESVQEWYEKRAELVAKAVGKALVLFPRQQEKLERNRVGEGRQQDVGDGDGRHEWTFSCGRWRCFLCGAWTRSQEVPEARRRQRCKGMKADDCMLSILEKGHRIRKTNGDLPFIYCVACGAWANRRMRKLLRECNGPSVAGREALRRIRQGMHPWRDEVKRGGSGQRAQIRTTSFFCAARLRWVPMRGTTSQEEEEEENRDEQEAMGGRTAQSSTQEDPAAQPALEGYYLAMGPAEEDEHEWSEEDAFGHGGSLNQIEEEQPEGRAAAAAGTGTQGEGSLNEERRREHFDQEEAREEAEPAPTYEEAKRARAQSTTRARKVRRVEADEYILSNIAARLKPAPSSAANKIAAFKERWRQKVKLKERREGEKEEDAESSRKKARGS